MNEASGQARWYRVEDLGWLAGSVGFFGSSLGMVSVLVPLLALESEMRLSTIGLLAALAAGSQMMSKMGLPWLLSRFSDRTLMVFAVAALGAGAVFLLFGRSILAFSGVQILQGVSRGLFHTASQTHAARTPGVPTRRLAFIQAMTQMGRLTGPAIAGTLALVSLNAALIAAGIAALLSIGSCSKLVLKPMYERSALHERRPVWRQTGVGIPAWGGAIGGTWSGIEESYVPVILDSAGLAAGPIGWLISLADAASFTATAILARWAPQRVGRLIPIAAGALALALVSLPFLGSFSHLAAALMVAGAGGGLGMVLGVGAMAERAQAGEQGAAIALVGIYRAAARLVTPIAIGGLLAVGSMGLALTSVGLAVVIPSTRLLGKRSR